MADLVWTYAASGHLACEHNGLKVVVDKSPVGTGYRYRVSSKLTETGTLASGYREDLRDALDAADRVSRTLAA